MAQFSRASRAAGVLAVAVLLLAGCTNTSAADPVGTWTESSDAEAPTLTLNKDGTLKGFDGCNQLTGSWEATDFGVNFEDFAATQMFCEGVDIWLAGAASAQIGGNEMTVQDTDGQEIGVLTRSDEASAG